MKVIFTGGSGFIGTHAHQTFLLEGHSVLCISHEDSFALRQEKISKYIEADGRGVDLVIHLAGHFIYDQELENIHDLISAHFSYGVELLELMRHFRISNILWTGTLWQEGSLEHSGPVNFYAALKKSFEEMVKYYVQAYNFSAVELKLSNTYGPQDFRQKLIPVILKNWKEGKTVSLKGSDQKMNLVYIDDLVKAFLMTAHNLVSRRFLGFQSFALAAGDDYSIKEVSLLVEQVIKKTDRPHIQYEWQESASRFREPYHVLLKDPILPHWSCEVSLREGLDRIFKLDSK